MSNHFVQKIASVILVLGIFVSIFMAVQTANAQTVIPSGVPFGGAIAFTVPPSPVCTAHTVIFDLVTYQPLGLAVVPGSQVYMNFDLTTPGKLVLGSYLPTPIPCLLPYLIVPISQVGTS